MSPLLGRLHQRRHAAAVGGRDRSGSAATARPCPRGRDARSGTPSAPCRWRSPAPRSRSRYRSASAVRSAAPLVGRLVAHRHVDQAQCLVGAGDRSSCSASWRVGLRRRRRRGLVRAPGIPGPDQPAGIDVVGADHAGRLLRREVVGDLAGDDDEVAGHDRRRGRVVHAGLSLRHALPQIDLPVRRRSRRRAGRCRRRARSAGHRRSA